MNLQNGVGSSSIGASSSVIFQFSGSSSRAIFTSYPRRFTSFVSTKGAAHHYESSSPGQNSVDGLYQVVGLNGGGAILNLGDVQARTLSILCAL
jgi:hypothetical protein